MTLKLIATKYDPYWHRQHFKGVDNKREYCTVDNAIYTFAGEPECPLRSDVNIIEVDKDGNIVKTWQTA